MTLQAGTFRARGVSGALGYTKDHNPQVVVELQILDDDHAGETLAWYGFFTEKTQERTLEALRILGWKTDDLSDLDGITSNEIDVVVKEEEFEGVVRLRAAWINRRGGAVLKAPMSPQEAKAFAASMRGKAVASRAATGTPTAGKPAAQRPRTAAKEQPPVSGETDDGIPF